MTLEQIKAAVNAGKKVFWASTLYEVRKDSNGSFNIVCTSNNNAIGLTWTDGITMNGEPEQFFEEINLK